MDPVEYCAGFRRNCAEGANFNPPGVALGPTDLYCEDLYGPGIDYFIDCPDFGADFGSDCDCTIFINGQKCTSCQVCGASLVSASFDCTNVLGVTAACTGRTCFGDCPNDVTTSSTEGDDDSAVAVGSRWKNLVGVVVALFLLAHIVGEAN